MNMLCRLCASLVIAGGLLLSGVNAASAQVSFTFVESGLSGNAGDPTPLLYRINLENGSLEAGIDGLSVTFDGNTLPDGIIDVSPFTTNPSIPDPLSANYSSAVDFFTVNLQGVNGGVYTGTATFLYTTDGLTDTPVSQPFTLTVEGNVSAPEPGTLALFALPTIIGGTSIIRRKKA